jgi:hypothetical protein
MNLLRQCAQPNMIGDNQQEFNSNVLPGSTT